MTYSKKSYVRINIRKANNVDIYTIVRRYMPNYTVSEAKELAESKRIEMPVEKADVAIKMYNDLCSIDGTSATIKVLIDK